MTLEEQIEAARLTYEETDEGSLGEQKALNRWNKLSLRQVDLALSVEEAEIALQAAPQHSPAENSAKIKLNMLLLEAIRRENSLSGLRYLCSIATRGSEARQEGLRKWDKKGLEVLSHLKNFKQLRSIRGMLPEASSAGCALAKKWDQMVNELLMKATTADELRQAYSLAAEMCCAKAEKEAWTRLDALLLKEAQAVDTTDGLRALLQKTLPCSRADELVRRKLRKLAEKQASAAKGTSAAGAIINVVPRDSGVQKIAQETPNALGGGRVILMRSQRIRPRAPGRL